MVLYTLIITSMSRLYFNHGCKQKHTRLMLIHLAFKQNGLVIIIIIIIIIMYCAAYFVTTTTHIHYYVRKHIDMLLVDEKRNSIHI
jgi:Ca2+/H+ antiporter